MDTGTFIRRFIASMPRRSGWLVLPEAGWQPQHRLLSGGYELRHDEVYDWSEAQRTDEPMANIQLTISGEGRLRIGGRDYRVGPGQAMVCVQMSRTAIGYRLVDVGNLCFSLSLVSMS